MIGILILAAFTLFLAGLVLGLLCTPQKGEKTRKTAVPKIPDPVTDELRAEYDYFLSYDGTEQS